MVWNQGVTFGLFHQDTAAGPWLLAGVALAVVVALAIWTLRAETALVATALGAIAGGAVGNILDRVRFGAVVDFIHAHAWGYSWYVFNIADAAIVCGVGALLLDGALPSRRRPTRHRRACPAGVNISPSCCTVRRITPAAIKDGRRYESFLAPAAGQPGLVSFFRAAGVAPYRPRRTNRPGFSPVAPLAAT